MMHLEIYSGSIATGTSPLIVVPAVATQIYPVQSNGFLIQQLNKIIMADQVGTGAVRAQLQSPSLRVQPFIDIVPSNRGTVHESPPRFMDWTSAPLSVRSNEVLNAFATQNSGGAAIAYVGVWFADGPQRATPNLPFLTVHATAAATLTAAAWSAVTPALDVQLDPGTYAIIGMRVFSATALYARLIPNSGGQTFRPGVSCVQAYDGYDNPYFRAGSLGQLMTFSTTNIPQVEMFATTADTAEEFWFDLVQLSNSLQG